MTDDRNLCSLCIQEGELRDWLERSGSEGDCDFDPGHTSVTCVSVDEFAEEADRWFQQHYQPGGPTIEIDPDPESAGHGTMIDNQFYLVPYGADSSSMEHLKADAIPATEFRSEIEKLAQHGRVEGPLISPAERQASSRTRTRPCWASFSISLLNSVAGIASALRCSIELLSAPYGTR